MDGVNGIHPYATEYTRPLVLTQNGCIEDEGEEEAKEGAKTVGGIDQSSAASNMWLAKILEEAAAVSKLRGVHLDAAVE